MRLAGLAKGGYYPTPLRCVDLMSNFIKAASPKGRAEQEAIRILDPCCGPGDACERLAARLSQTTMVNIRTFGVELEQERAQQAREQMDFTLSSDLFQTMIANNAFHVLFLNPPYDHDQEEKRVEQAFLAHCTKYLVENGLLILIVPRHRLAVSARYLAANYTNLRCWRFPDPEYEDFDQIALMGHRLSQPEASPHDEEKIRNWAHCPLDQVDTLEKQMKLQPMTAPSGERSDILFTVRTVDPARAAAEAQRTGLWTSQTIRDSLWPERDRKVQPLMPLKHGHMAMLVAAGFVDNLCLEAGGNRILVKGRTVKKMEMVSSNDNEKVREEVWQDRMYTTIRTLDLNSGRIENVETRGKPKRGNTE